MKAFKFLCCFALSVAAFVGCQPNKTSNADDALTEAPKIAVDGTDSLIVDSLVAGYMNALVDGRYDDALGMLVMVDPKDINSEPQPVTDEYKAQMTAAYKSFPIKEWRLREYLFNQAYNSVAICDVVLKNGIKSKMQLKPVNYIGEWRLSIMESMNGD